MNFELYNGFGGQNLLFLTAWLRLFCMAAAAGRSMRILIVDLLHVNCIIACKQLSSERLEAWMGN